MEKQYIRHCKGHNAKVFILMMHRNQIWFHGTTAGIIYHMKDPFNASLQSDQSPELKNKQTRILGFAHLPSENRCHQMRRVK